jgi:putative acetyltransferase
MKQTVTMREASISDRDAVHSVHVSAFPENESEAVAKLAVDLLAEASIPRTFTLVAEVDGAVVGHVGFSPVTNSSSGELTGYILAPLAIKPEFQKQKIGSRLIEYGLQQLSDEGVCLLFVYGDPDYYGRFGFNTDIAAGFTPPYTLEYPFGWQAVAINDCGAETPSAAITCVDSLSDPSLW